MRKIVLITLFLCLLVLALFFALRRGEVRYALVEEREVSTLVYGSGYVRNADYVLVRAEVSGYLKDILVKEGDHVKRGQVLAIIDSGSLEEGIKEVSERLKLVRERAMYDSSYLSSLQSSVEASRINMENSKRLFERRERLFSQGLIPKEAYEQSKTQYEVAQKEYERSKKAYADALISIRAEERVLSAQRQKLLREKEKYTIRSPIEGYVLKKFVNQGDYINHMGQENRLFSIGSKDWEVWLEVDEGYAGLIREGQKARVKVDAFPERDFEGVVFQVIREVDRARKLITAKVRANLPPETPSGATADGQIEVERRRALVIPAKAYSNGHVLLQDGARKLKVSIKTGKQYGDFIEVLGGLKPGDRVILP
ncbi:MAG: efflux RND transporter periplasmic adaptor subunit [Aquificaceae bacterium]|nr:efflux RND transporter periplasmic adaptor subunit [Aquificaceae bacterium]